MPATETDFIATREKHFPPAGQPVAVVAIPLLFETKAKTEFDAVICVACTAQTQ